MKFQGSLTAAVGVFSLIQGTHAWGAMGHQTIAYIAQNFVTPATATYCQNILGDTSGSYMASVATWADSYRYTKAGAFSRGFHFIDAQDDPPNSCGVDYNRDCGKGCVVSAINNYTNTLLGGQDLNSLKFLIHFIGDLHQPLHDEALDLGGNRIAVTYNGATSNLHHIWDTEMPNMRAGGATISTASTYSQTLINEITNGAYASAAAGWISGINVNDPITTSMGWVQEANAFVCSTVLNQGLSYVEGNDLSTDYYNAALPIFEEQIAKAGYRLAAWLNLIATGSPAM